MTIFFNTFYCTKFFLALKCSFYLAFHVFFNLFLIVFLTPQMHWYHNRGRCNQVGALQSIRGAAGALPQSFPYHHHHALHSDVTHSLGCQELQWYF